MRPKLPHLAMATGFIALLTAANVAQGGADTDLTVGVIVDSRTGLFASGTSAEGTMATELALTPILEYAVTTRRNAFLAAYRLRLSTRTGDIGRFNLSLYQQATLRNDLRVSRTVSWLSEASASMGILDYSSALRLFDPENEIAANLPNQDDFRFYTVTASTGVTKRLTRLSVGSLSLRYQTQRPYGYDSEEVPLFSSQDQGTLQAMYGHALTQRDAIRLDVNARLVLNSPGVDYVPILALLEWRRALTARSSGSLMAGATAIYQFGQPADTEDDIEANQGLAYLLPQAGFSYNTTIPLRHRRVLTGALTGQLSVYFDRITASIQQLAQLGLSGSLSLPPSWAITAQATVFTLFSPAPLGTTSSAPGTVIIASNDYPTTVFLSIGASYEISDYSLLSFGVTSNIRSTHLWDPPVDVRGFEEVLFFITISTRKNLMD